jgi:hypothetical protein
MKPYLLCADGGSAFDLNAVVPTEAAQSNNAYLMNQRSIGQSVKG